MSVSKRAQWRRLLVFSALVGIVGRVPHTQASSFYLPKPADQQPAGGSVDVGVGVAAGVANDNANAAVDGAAYAPVHAEAVEMPMEVLPAAMATPSQGAAPENDSDAGDQPDGEPECDDAVEEEEYEEEVQNMDNAWSNEDEKPEINNFGPPDYLVNTDVADSSSTTTDPYITSTTTIPSATEYNPILFWTVTTSTQPEASPVLNIPFDSMLDNGSPPGDSAVVDGAPQSTQQPEDVVALANPNNGSAVLGFSIVGGALAILMVVLISILVWAYRCPCGKRSRRNADDDMDCDDDMGEKYTIPAQMRGALQEDNGLWLEEWRKRKEEVLNMREPPEVHVSNAVPMSPPLDLEYGREPEKFYNCPL